MSEQTQSPHVVIPFMTERAAQIALAEIEQMGYAGAVVSDTRVAVAYMETKFPSHAA